jgi:ATP adenylyltransferase
VSAYIKARPGELQLHDIADGSSPFSYNMAMTTTSIILCPRRREGKMLQAGDGSDIGFVAFNGTLLAGTLMVKGEKEWKYLREEKGVLDKVLDAIGVPKAEESAGTKI